MHTVAHLLRPVSGGILGHWKALARRAHEYDFRLVVLSSERNDLKELEPYADQIHTLPLLAQVNPWADLRSIYLIRRYLREIGPDVIHLHGFKAALAGGIARGRSETPLIYTVHNFLAERGNGFSRIYPYLERHLARRCQAIICVSSHQAGFLAGISGYPVDRLNIIPNGIQVGRFQVSPDERQMYRQEIREKLGWEPHDLIILTVARLIPAKGLDTLLQSAETLSRVKGLRFLIAGDGPYKADYLAQAQLVNRVAGYELVRLAGNIPDLVPYYAGADLFVLPSWSEGLPLSVLEAQASGLAVVASDVGGIGEAVSSGETGLLVKAKDAGELTQAITRLIRSSGERAQLGAKGQARVEATFTEEAMVRQTYELYQTTLDLRGRRV